MQESLDEDDLALIHALQICPRGSWADLAAIIGSSAATLAKRWTRLTEAGLAWITAYPHPATMPNHVVGLIEIDAAAPILDDLSRLLATERRAVHISHQVRGGLLLTVIAGSLDDFSQLLLGDLATMSETRVTNHVITRSHLEASRWRLNALEPRQIQQLQRLEAGSVDARTPDLRALTPSMLTIAEALVRDGRASAKTIAEQIDRPDSTVRRQLGALLRSRALSFRCEIAQSYTRWPVTVSFWCRTPAVDRPRLLDQLMSEPRVRTCMSVAGRANFVVTIWVESISEILPFQEWLESYMPSGEILDTSIVLQATKRMGWILEPDGRASGTVVPYVVTGPSETVAEERPRAHSDGGGNSHENSSTSPAQRSSRRS
ncbi:Lrp/AsnC family transcriptional regulator [Nocardia fluminea]|uniref:Lrp/AsnC family transcriptional regulator n=1 Tax=Nocardia fluminea TaxID=134984 RepID=UPI00341127A2